MGGGSGAGGGGATTAGAGGAGELSGTCVAGALPAGVSIGPSAMFFITTSGAGSSSES